LLEGLEISEIRLSYLRKRNDIFRFDSNYFQKQFLLEESTIRHKKHETLKSLETDLKSFGAYSLNNQVTYLESGVPFIRGINMKDGRVSFNNMIYIDETANSLLWKSEIKPEMVLVSMSGTIGDVAIASKNWKYPINSNQDIAKIDTQGKLNPYFLHTFLRTKFGQNYFKREARGSVQQHVYLSQMEEFEIPIFSNSFTDLIQKIVENSTQSLEKSESKYNLASKRFMFEVGFVGNDNYGSLEENLKDWVSDDPDEQLLANLIPGAREELEMLEEEWDRIMDKYKFYEQIADYDNQISYFRKNENRLTRLATLIEDKRLELKCIRNNRNIINYNFVFRKNKNIKSFKESFGTTGRLDAEYYQQKYEFVIEHLQKSNYEKLVDIVSISKSIEPGSAHYSEDEGLPFYRVSDLSKFGMSKPDKTLTDSFVKHNSNQIESLKPQKDTILFSKDGSVGTAYLLGENLQGITSGAILHLKIKDSTKVLPAYLTLVLNSKLVQMQAERDAGGSIILHWRVSEIENVIVPIVAIEIQEKIAELVEESFALKSKSEQLLSTAKRAVEMAIEEGEEVALAWIEGEVT
jgi:restriction endonuclease S subunit